MPCKRDRQQQYTDKRNDKERIKRNLQYGSDRILTNGFGDLDTKSVCPEDRCAGCQNGHCSINNELKRSRDLRDEQSRMNMRLIHLAIRK